MWQIIHSELKKDHHYASSPISWPFKANGITLWISKKENSRIYFTVNPIVWYITAISILISILYQGVQLLLAQRRIQIVTSGYHNAISQGSIFFTSGYVLNYLPFFLTSQTVFFTLIRGLFVPLFTFSIFWNIMRMRNV